MLNTSTSATALDEIYVMENSVLRFASERNENNNNTNASVEPVTPRVNTSVRPLNTIELDYHNVDYVETQSLGLEHSADIFWYVMHSLCMADKWMPVQRG